MRVLKKKKKKKTIKSKSADCNIRRLKEIGATAIKVAIMDYEEGDRAGDMFEQIARVLYVMQLIEESKRPDGLKES